MDALDAYDAIPAAAVEAALLAYYDEGDLPAQYPKLLGMMRIALTAALPHLSGWRPIADAPRDGTAILGLWLPSPGAYTRITGNNYGIVAFDTDNAFWSLVDDGDEPDGVMRPDLWQPLTPPGQEVGGVVAPFEPPLRTRLDEGTVAMTSEGEECCDE